MEIAAFARTCVRLMHTHTLCSQVYLNRSICSRTCSSAVSFRLDAIAAIPLTFSTKRRHTRGRTRVHAQPRASFPVCLYKHRHTRGLCAGLPPGVMSQLTALAATARPFMFCSSTQANQIKARLFNHLHFIQSLQVPVTATPGRPFTSIALAHI